MMERRNNLKKVVKFLLEIKGDTKNSLSIFDRLSLSPKLDFEKILEYEFNDENFAATIPAVEAILLPNGHISSTKNPLEMLIKKGLLIE